MEITSASYPLASRPVTNPRPPIQSEATSPKGDRFERDQTIDADVRSYDQLAKTLRTARVQTPIHSDWTRSTHWNNDPADCNLRVAQPKQPQISHIKKPAPFKPQGQVSRPLQVTPVPLRVQRTTAPTKPQADKPIQEPSSDYPPNNPVSKKLLRGNITQAAVASAQLKDKGMRWHAFETLNARQTGSAKDGLIEEGSDLYYFNLGATGAAFHFDQDALVKYAGRNHDLIEPSQERMVRRGYAFAFSQDR